MLPITGAGKTQSAPALIRRFEVSPSRRSESFVLRGEEWLPITNYWSSVYEPAVIP
jgi:hypothetical protein